MNPVWIAFTVGILIGGPIGVILMGLLVRASRISRELQEGNEI